MAASAATPRLTDARRPPAPTSSSKFDRRLSSILAHATNVFYEKGYEGASMRDLSRASGMSLAGMYHYFESKEKLLYLIQKHTFSTIVKQLRGKLDSVQDPKTRVRIVILNHLEYFLANQKAMKVLSHEDEVLKNGFGAEVRALKREYYRICLDVLEDFKRVNQLRFSMRVAVLSLFGMMNWIYTWYNPRVDGDAAKLAEEMGNIFLNGIRHGKPAKKFARGN
jgi:AcrR family transcriptional regulator